MSVGSKLRKRLRSTPYRFQIRGVRFIEKYDGRVLIGDDMGVGKTLQSIGWLALHRKRWPVIVVCPASLKYTWQREFIKHAGMKSYVCEGEQPSNATLDRRCSARVRKVGRRKYNSLKQKRTAIAAVKRGFARQMEVLRKTRKEARKAKILIINYDILESWVPFLLSLNPEVQIIDECHFIKTRTAKRTKACQKIGRACSHVLGLSGTPMLNKPAELWPVLNLIRPDEFPSFMEFAMEFCNPKKSPYGWGWDFTGSSNLKALNKRLKKIMIRRMKVDVLKDLPPKQRSVIPIKISNREEYLEAEENFLAWLAKTKGKNAVKRAERAQAIVRLGALKRLAAEGKLKRAFRWIDDWMDSTDEKLLLFGYHKSIMSSLHEKYPKAAPYRPDLTGKKRDKEIHRFQTDKNTRLFLGHLKRDGVGKDFTAASNVGILELPWTPGELDQLEDRACRIGQTASSVNIYYLVGLDTVEERILTIIEEKDGICAQVLDGTTKGRLGLMQAFLDSL